jgi:hypothetical protein
MSDQEKQRGGIMKAKSSVIFMLLLAAAIPLSAKNHKNDSEMKKGILEKMEAVPCGAKQRGLAGLGTLWASAGVTHINSDEKLCPQYLLRGDHMDYEIRPMDLKHAKILPVGTEGEFKIKNNEMLLTMPESGDEKTHNYEVVAMNPNNPDSGDENQKSSSLSSDQH